MEPVHPVNMVTSSASQPITAHFALLGGVYRERGLAQGGVWLCSGAGARREERKVCTL